MENRILGNIVGEQLSAEDLEMISGGAGGGNGCTPNYPCCNGCGRSTNTGSISSDPGCKCD